MAIKIIENENGTVTEKTVAQVRKDRKIGKFKKAVGITAMTAAMLAMSSLTAFAANGENTAPSNVSTSTMSTMINIIMWIVRIAILAIGGIPGLIKIVQGQQEENPRDRNNGIVSVVIAIPVIVTTVSYLWLLQVSLLRLHSLLLHLSIRKRIHNLTWNAAPVSQGVMIGAVF